MIIPVRCFTSGKVIGNKWDLDLDLRAAGYEEKEEIACRPVVAPVPGRGRAGVESARWRACCATLRPRAPRIACPETKAEAERLGGD